MVNILALMPGMNILLITVLQSMAEWYSFTKAVIPLWPLQRKTI